MINFRYRSMLYLFSEKLLLRVSLAHGHFNFHHLWKQYLKIGELAKECARHIEALNGYIDSKTQVLNVQSISLLQIYLKQCVIFVVILQNYLFSLAGFIKVL